MLDQKTERLVFQEVCVQEDSDFIFVVWMNLKSLLFVRSVWKGVHLFPNGYTNLYGGL